MTTTIRSGTQEKTKHIPMRRSMTAKQAEETIQPGAIANLLTLIEQLKDTNARRARAFLGA